MYICNKANKCEKKGKCIHSVPHKNNITCALVTCPFYPEKKCVEVNK